ncbi:MAG: 4Fe-4S dicluster domain-containing protein [Candidatus Lokiarchaeota archaeon]|nr:4Fe-4S dicluster domain-containing protein [Candidatus Lokiarchaeota archaeon]
MSPETNAAGAKSNALLEAMNQHPLAGTDYLACIQCGRCVGSCPAAKVSRASPAFNMRVINKRIQEGDEQLLIEDAIWDCFYCQACVNLCPRDSIDPFKTIIILRDLALARGEGTKHLQKLLPVMRWYLEKGVLTDGESWMDPRAIAEVRRINSMTGATARVEQLELLLSRGTAINGGGKHA